MRAAFASFNSSGGCCHIPCRNVATRSCSKCRVYHYCSAACQALDARRHGFLCERYRRIKQHADRAVVEHGATWWRVVSTALDALEAKHLVRDLFRSRLAWFETSVPYADAETDHDGARVRRGLAELKPGTPASLGGLASFYYASTIDARQLRVLRDFANQLSTTCEPCMRGSHARAWFERSLPSSRLASLPFACVVVVAPIISVPVGYPIPVASGSKLGCSFGYLVHHRDASSAPSASSISTPPTSRPIVTPTTPTPTPTPTPPDAYRSSSALPPSLEVKGTVDAAVGHGPRLNREWLQRHPTHWLSATVRLLHSAAPDPFLDTGCELTAAMLLDRWSAKADDDSEWCMWPLRAVGLSFAQLVAQLPFVQISVATEPGDCTHALIVRQGRVYQSYFRRWPLRVSLVDAEFVAAVEQDVVTRDAYRVLTGDHDVDLFPYDERKPSTVLRVYVTLPRDFPILKEREDEQRHDALHMLMGDVRDRMPPHLVALTCAYL